MNERHRRIAALAALSAAPTAVLLAAGIVLGFPLEGLLLGAGIGCGLAGARELSRRRAVGFDALLLPTGGAAGAAFVTFVFGVRYLPQLASAAAFGWGTGLAAAVFLLILRDRPRRRIVFAALAAIPIAYLSLVISSSPLITYAALLVGTALVLLVLAVELGRELLTPSGAVRSLAAAAAVGAAAGAGFGAIGQWWYGFGHAFDWGGASGAWLGAATGGLLFGLSYAVLARLAELVRERSARRIAVPASIAAMAVAFGICGALFIGKDRGISRVAGTRLDEMLFLAAFAAVLLASTYLIRTRARGIRSKLVALAALWLPLGTLWTGPWPGIVPALTTTTPARSLLAMVPWKNTPGGPADSRPRLVQSAHVHFDYRALRRADVFGTAGNARLARRFRCLILSYPDYEKLTKGLKLKYPPSAVFLTPDGEEIDALWGG